MGVHASHIPALSFSTLNETLGGRLQVAIPLARPCFNAVGANVGGSTNHTECAEVIQVYNERHILSSQFGGYENTAWVTCQRDAEGCLLDGNMPNDTTAFQRPTDVCQQGNLPSYYIDVQGAQDVSTAFKFAKATGTTLAIKNTGHDYLGRSSGFGSLALWVHNLQNMSYSQNFVPQLCTRDGIPAVTFGAGASLRSLYEFADQHNVTLLGGADDSLAGGGGYLMGGGHSAFSNIFGMAVDQVVQFEIVTPDGQLRIANECSNSDLFFALRGGGGGTFGVVINITLKALPKLSTLVVRTAFNDIPSMDDQRKYVEFLIDNAEAWALQGWGGYIEPGLGMTFVNPLLNMSTAAAVMKPLQQLVTSELNGTFLLQRTDSYLSFYDQFVDPTSLPNGVSGAIASRVMPATVFKNEVQRSRLLNAIMDGNAKHSITLLFAVAPYFFKPDSDDATSLNPLWRSSIWHVIFQDFVAFNSSAADAKRVYSNIDSTAQAFRDIAPDAAVYFNEASIFEPNFSESFWGVNYQKLLEIKKKYDPNHILDCWKCVGWKGESASRYRCYPEDT